MLQKRGLIRPKTTVIIEHDIFGEWSQVVIVARPHFLDVSSEIILSLYLCIPYFPVKSLYETRCRVFIQNAFGCSRLHIREFFVRDA